MGRSRAPPSAEEDPNQRSKRKKSASTGGTLESVTGQGTNELKRALYHCNYCNKDISGKIRIKCVDCPDFDLCIECFSVGAEVTPHKSNHNYRVMDNLSFPLICADWNADEEILLLEGIEMYGLGNWTEVAEHVGTKSKAQCIDHYTTAYLNSPCFPLPDMSHAVGKNRKELLAMAEDQGEGKKGFPVLGKLNLKEESPFCPFTVKAEDLTKGRAAGQSSSSLTKGSSIGPSGTHTSSGSTVKKTSNTSQIRDVQDAIKVEEDSQIDRSIGGKKPRSSMDEGPSLTDLSGYNPKRQEFDPEYDNDAEQSLAEMEFKETDTEAERDLKLQVLRIYIKRLDERKRRKDFILERNLLYPNPFEKNLSPEEKEICQRLKVFMRFHSKEEHQCLLQTLIEDHRARKRIQDLQEARAAGCHTSAEADRYLEQKRKKEAEESSHSVKDSAQVGPNVKVLPRVNHLKGEPDSDSPRGIVNGSMESGDKDSSVAVESATLSSLADWDIAGLPGTDLLSETEKRLCCEIRLLPSHYLKMQRTMSMEIFNGNIIKKSDAHGLFRVNPRKVDKVYDMLVKKGVVSA